jgi:2-iminoacetate synthase
MNATSPAPAPPLGVLEALTLRVNDHPEARLPLLRDALRTLETSGASIPQPSLADRVERWRYQLVNHRSGRLDPDEAALADGLDRLTARLWGQERPTRCLRRALASARPETSLVRAFDPTVSLESLEIEARALTLAHHGTADARPRMMLYAPLYLANHCINYCLYCGFRFPAAMERQKLDAAQAGAEADELARRGFRHVLLVAGEHPGLVTVDYLADITRRLVARGHSIAVEVAPLSTLGYATLRDAGACGVTLYQEVYDESRYASYHPKGTKTWYDWRIEAPERAAEAGIKRLGLGILLGLGELVPELAALMAHGRYLEARFPGIRLAFSLPRIREAPEGFDPPVIVNDDQFLRAYCALRLAFPTATLTLSTREPAELRDRMARTMITQLSAGSSTAPGGYVACGSVTGDVASSCQQQQFPVFDHRSVNEVAESLSADGFALRYDFDPV